jgi:Polyketide cyclase / dehydrase and lipid transport
MVSAAWLRYALRANALFALGCGGLALVFAVGVAASLALPPWVVAVVGGGLVIYGVGLVLLSARARVASAWTVAATVLDVGWVVASAAFLVIHRVPSVALVVIPAAIVLGFAWLQLEGLRRTLFAGRVGRYALERRVHASADRAWRVVSDVARYAEVAGTLHRSEILSGSGVGMVRRCEDTSGVCWLETCARWEPGQAYAFEVDTSAPGYPLPLTTMRGDFEVEPIDGGHSTVRVRFTFVARGGGLYEWFLAVVFALRGDALVGAILERWALRIERPEPTTESPC